MFFGLKSALNKIENNLMKLKNNEGDRYKLTRSISYQLEDINVSFLRPIQKKRKNQLQKKFEEFIDSEKLS